MLTHVIVPIFNDSDLQALPNCLRYLAQQNVETLLVLHGPNVGVVNGDATKEFDRKIANLDTRKRELTLVEDFAGAQKVKEEIETLKVDRDIAIRDAWKNVPEDQRAAMYKKAFGNIGTEAICLREAYQYDQVFNMLQSFLAQWPSDIPHGEYSLVWPRSVGAVALLDQTAGLRGDTQSGTTQIVADPLGQPIRVSTVKQSGRDSREKELKMVHHLKVFQLARKAGIDTTEMNTKQVIQALLDKEFPAQQIAA